MIVQACSIYAGQSQVTVNQLQSSSALGLQGLRFRVMSAKTATYVRESDPCTWPGTAGEGSETSGQTRVCEAKDSTCSPTTFHQLNPTSWSSETACLLKRVHLRTKSHAHGATELDCGWLGGLGFKAWGFSVCKH